MQSLIWAFGSMIALVLFISFLPLGFTFRGKLLIAMVSFVLSLTGLATVTVLSFWQIAIVLLLLSFLTAYMMDRRIGNFIHAVNEKFEEVLEVEMYEENSIEDSKTKIVNEETLLEVPTIESVENIETHNKIDALNPDPILSAPETEFVIVNEMLDVDESFLLDRELEHEVVSEDKTDLEEDYLSDIESMLVEDLDVKHVEIEDFDSLEILFSSMDAESERDETEKSEKKLVLQK